MADQPLTSFSNSILRDMSVQEFLAQLAAKTPTPGGGSVAALTGALAAAQAHMVLAYTIGKPKFASWENELNVQAARFQTAIQLFIELMELDQAAYDLLNPILKLSQEDRLKHPQFAAAVLAAIRIPQSVGAAALQVLLACNELVDKVNPLLISDLGAAGSLANAAVETSEFNVRVNLELLPDKAEANPIAAQMTSSRQNAKIAWEALQTKITAHLKI
jgi:formiminotetrahydrofolate cyclodeaminase